MRTGKLLLAALLMSVTVASSPARAWWFEEDGETWPMFDFHRYGGDVNRPPITPDRPYFHGDDAVPLGMRWRDLDAAASEAAADDLAAAAAARVAIAVPVREPARRRSLRRRRSFHRVARICIPAPAATVHR